MAKKFYKTKYDYIKTGQQEKVVVMGYYSNKRQLSRLLNIAWILGCLAVGYELFLRGAS